MINWLDPRSKVTDNFTVKDCLWLNTWTKLATQDDGLTDDIIAELIDTCHLAEEARDILGVPLIVTSMYRPPSYSVEVGGRINDVHTKGLAIDFIPKDMDINDAKSRLLPLLQSLDCRMENNGRGANWIHLDRSPVIHNRFFVP